MARPLIIPGEARPRPYIFIDYDYAMNVVWHYYKLIKTDILIYFFRTQPDLLYNLSYLTKPHRSINNPTENTSSLTLAYRHKIRARLRIIVILQAD